MIDLTLNHDKSPDKLRQLNESLVVILSSDEIDGDKLLEQINIRQSYVETYLSGLEGSSKKEFASLEYEINQQLVNLISKVAVEAKNSTANFLKAQKAVKQYR